MKKLYISRTFACAASKPLEGLPALQELWLQGLDDIDASAFEDREGLNVVR